MISTLEPSGTPFDPAICLCKNHNLISFFLLLTLCIKLYDFISHTLTRVQSYIEHAVHGMNIKFMNNNTGRILCSIVATTLVEYYVALLQQ